MPVDPLDPEGEREAVVSGVGVRDSGGSDLVFRLADTRRSNNIIESYHASLAHGKGGYDCEPKNGEGGLLW